ncbi:MAG: CsbD family protein [Halobacteriales archaeon]|nr:CsbD family protein [Halobacteriales archaeon]
MSTDRRLEDPRDRAAAEKGKGHVKEVVGKVKQEVGHAVGDEDVETRGAAERAEGRTDRMKGEIREKVEDVKDYARAGAEVVKDKLGKDERRH